MFFFASLILIILLILFVGMTIAFTQRKNKNAMFHFICFCIVLTIITAGVMFYMTPVFNPALHSSI